MNKQSSGFTMLELIMVVIIIGTLASLAIPQYASFVDKARGAEAVNYMGTIKSAQISYGVGQAGGNYGANLSVLGLTTNNTKYWTYTTAGSGNVSFYVEAERIGSGGGSCGSGASNIRLNYYNTGEHEWSGTDIAVPES